MFQTAIERFRRASSLGHYNAGFLRFLGPGRAAFLGLVAILVSGLNTLNYAALIPILNGMTTGDSQLSGLPPVFGQVLPVRASMIELALLVVLIFAAKVAANILFSFLAGSLGEQYLCLIRQGLLKAYLESSYFRADFSPSYFFHLNQQVPRIGTLNWSFISFGLRLAMAAALLVALLFLGRGVALGALLFCLVLILFLLPAFRYTRAKAREYASTLARLQQFICEEMVASDIVRIWGLRGARSAKLQKISAGLVSANSRLSIARAFVQNLQEFLLILAAVIAWLAKSKLGLNLGLLLGLGLLLSKFLGALNEAATHFNSALEAFDPAKEVLDRVGRALPVGPLEKAEASSVKSETIRRIHWRNSTLSLEASRGDRILVAGAVGKGKTTLVKHLLDLVGSRAEFSVNGGPWGPVTSVRDYYSRISYLPQQPVLLEGTVGDNIHLGIPSLVERLPGLLSDIGLVAEEIYPQGLETRVQEAGRNLSGGQAQMIGVLRALLRPADILVLDEPANHLGAELVKKVDSYLARVDDRIILAISHVPLSFSNREILAPAPVKE